MGREMLKHLIFRNGGSNKVHMCAKKKNKLCVHNLKNTRLQQMQFFVPKCGGFSINRCAFAPKLTWQEKKNSNSIRNSRINKKQYNFVLYATKPIHSSNLTSYVVVQTSPARAWENLLCSLVKRKPHDRWHAVEWAIHLGSPWHKTQRKGFHE